MPQCIIIQVLGAVMHDLRAVYTRLLLSQSLLYTIAAFVNAALLHRVTVLSMLAYC
jgi:hypothetical protein